MRKYRLTVGDEEPEFAITLPREGGDNYLEIPRDMFQNSLYSDKDLMVWAAVRELDWASYSVSHANLASEDSRSTHEKMEAISGERISRFLYGRVSPDEANASIRKLTKLGNLPLAKSIERPGDDHVQR